MLIDDLGAAGAGHVGGNQFALDRRGGEPLVPQRDRELRQARQIAGKGTRRLRARTLGPIHVDGEPEDKRCGLAFGGEHQKPRRVGGKILARNGLDAGGQSPVGIAGGDADGLGAEVKAYQRATDRQIGHQFDQRKDQCRHRR